MKSKALRLIFTLTFLASVVLSTSSNAYALTLNGGDDWNVEFNSSKKMVSNFKDKSFDDILDNMEPGDDAKFEVKVKNTYKTDTEWYMTNKIIKSLEDSSKTASGGGYSYILTYTGPSGTVRTLYNSENVGGEDYLKNLQGLHEATQALQDFFYLDTLKPGEQGRLNLRVLLDGETQGNDYQDTLAQLQMNFAVELPPEAGDEIVIQDRIKNFFKSGFVKTSDDTNLLILYIIAAVIGVLLLIIGIICIRIRKKMKGADEE